MATYLPSTDAGILSWAQGFAGYITNAPSEYGLTEPEALAYQAAVTAYETALAVATNAGTRTTPSIQTKNTRKKDLIAATRPLVNKIQIFPGTTDTMRADLRITIRDTDPTPVPLPELSPVLTVAVVMGRTIKVNLRARENDGNPSETRARPAGVKGAVLYYAVGETFPENIDSWTFKGNTTLTTFEVTIPDTVPGGSTVWLTAQWTNTKLQTGPACPPVSTNIAGGLSQAA